MTNKFILILSALISLFVNTAAQEPKKNELCTLPDVEVYDENGVHTTLHQLAKNKVIFIDCWFIPCPPCFVEMGVLHKVYAEFAGNKNLCFITICMTDSSQVKAFIRQDKVMKAYVSQYQYFSNLKSFTLPVYFIPGCNSKVPTGTKVLSHYPPDDKSKCPDAIFEFQGYPTSMVFNKSGRQVFKETGFDRAEEYEKRLKAALNAALSDTK
jgi:thiol-disulfide isomerase/thioredoxin